MIHNSIQEVEVPYALSKLGTGQVPPDLTAFKPDLYETNVAESDRPDQAADLIPYVEIDCNHWLWPKNRVSDETDVPHWLLIKEEKK